MARMSPEHRKSQILTAALRLAEKGHYNSLTSPVLARESGCGHTLIFHHFPCMDDLKTAVVEYAVANNNLRVIGQAVVARHKAVAKLDKSIKEKAVNALM